MDKGYLLILVGAILSATIVLPLPLPFEILDLWHRVSLWGYVLIAVGIRYLHASQKELDNARMFTYGALIAALGLSWLPSRMTLSSQVMFLMMTLHLFFSLGLFFWLFKAEYMWAPHANKRIDWMLYSGIALVHLIMFLIPAVAVVFGTQNFNLILAWLFMSTTIYTAGNALAITTMSNAFVLINLLYNIVLFYILIKLYLEARKNGSGLKRWN